MSCKPFKTTEANAKSFLRTKGAIDNFLNILDISKFRQFHGELINQAKKYIPNFSDKLFYEQNGGKKAIPNTQAFKDIDNAKGFYYSLKPDSQVNYILKSANALQSDKVRNPKNNLQGFYNDLQKQGVPNQQIEIIKSLNPENKTKEELLTELLANYSYTVEINTAKEKEGLIKDGTEFRVGEDYYYSDPVRNVYKILYSKDNGGGSKNITKEEFENARQNSKPTSYYSNLTVNEDFYKNNPDWEYKEQRLTTPLIIPSIKGHAQFAENNDIGWFRAWYNKKTGEVHVLEVQSDLFQKGRDKEFLVDNYKHTPGDRNFNVTYEGKEYKVGTMGGMQRVVIYKTLEGQIHYENPKQDWLKPEEIPQGLKDIVSEKFNNLKQEVLTQNKSNRENQFLQLLNKDNNWVTFFVKSIIQDSAKKGYEKVLFPRLDTIIQVESQNKFKTYAEAEAHYKDAKWYEEDKKLRKVLAAALDKPKEEQNQEHILRLKEQIAAHQPSLLNTAKFYEYELANRLDDIAGGNKNNRAKGIWALNQITDEYGNTWNEVVIKPEHLENILLSKKTEVEKILTEGNEQVKQLVYKPISEVKLDKVKKPEVIKKMKEILNILGIKTEIANLPEEIAAQADILNRLIQFADDSITEDNFTEETIHFIVEILEQKNKPLFDKLMSEIWKYNIYTNVKKEYSTLKQYQNEDGTPNINKIKKEAIGQLLVAKLLDTQEIKDEKNFLGSIWDAISRFIKDLFYNIPYGQRDSFTKLADEILKNPELVKAEDAQYLGQSSVFFSKKPVNKMASSLYKAKKLFGKESTSKFNLFEDNQEIFEYFKDLDSKIQKVTEKELNPETKEYEDVEYYVFNGDKKQRVTSVIKEANNKTYNNLNQDEQAKALREAKKQKGTEVHKTIEDILNRYIDNNTGELRPTPLNKPLNLSVPKEVYDKLENHLQNRLISYPKGTKFLMETKVVNEEQGYAGTIDFIAILPNKQVDILDWKTTDVSYWEAGIKRKRFDISPYNQTYWKTQLSFYKRALESHGIDNFRYTRAIPIALETKQTLIDKNQKYTPDNTIYQISKIEVGDSDPKKIAKETFYLTPVSVFDESTGIEGLDALLEKLQGVYDRIQKTTYKKEEAYKKWDELNRLNLAIREIQTKKTATLFTNLFTENFDRFSKLTDKDFDFLNDIQPNQKFLSLEQEQELHQYLNDIYSAIEFLQTFQNFPGVIGELYKEGELTDYEKEVKKAAVEIGGKSQTIAIQLINNATDIMDKLGKLYNIESTSQLDRKDVGNFTNFISILHREEGSIQFTARLLNAIKFLGNQEVDKFFNEDDGKFSIVYKSVLEWAKQNKKSIDQVYELLLNKDKEGKPVRELLSKIKTEFFTELQDKQKQFSDYYKAEQDILSDIGYKGEKYLQQLASNYKKYTESWLSSNFNIVEYQKSYNEALEKYKQSNKDTRLDEDALINEEKKRKRLQSWIEEHDIFNSPKALTSRNYLLYQHLNESKWYSNGYKTLLKSENKPLLEAYNLFTELNDRADKNGMMDDIFNSKRFIPNVVDPSLSKSIIYALKQGGLSPWYALKYITNFVKEHIGFVKEIESIEPQLDPLTKKQLRRIPVQFKYLKEGQEKDLSNDLFEIYAKWANHIIRYEMLSNYENRFKMVQLLESLKKESFAVDNKGQIVRKKDRHSQLYTLEKDTTQKSSTVENDLEKIINNYVYSSTLDIKPEWYKLGNLLYDYTALNFLGVNITGWIANITGASISAKLLEGKWFNKHDFLNISVNTTLGIFNKDIAKYGDNLYKKSKFLINKLDTRVLSEYDRDPSSKYAKSKIKIGDTAFVGFRLGDHFIQDALASSMFLNTTIINGKFVNINDLVKAKYDNKIYKSTSQKERKSLINQRDKEIENMKKSSNLYRFVKEKNGKLELDGVDLSTLEGKSELLAYQNKITHYIKAALGNIDEFDKSVARMNWYMKFIMQFKNWMPRVIGSRFQDIEYQYELDDYHYGRGKIFIDSFRANMKDTVLEVMKSIQLIIPFIDKQITNQSIINLAKSQYLLKKSEAISKNQQFDLTEDQFVDIYVNGFKNQMTEFANIIQFMLAVSFVAMAYAGSDDKDKWYWKILSRTLFKVKRELLFTYDPNQQISFLSNGAIPVLGSLGQLVNVLDSYQEELRGDIGQLLNIEGAEDKSKKAKPLSQTLKATPILREFHYWLSAISEDYADFMEIDQPKVQLE